MGSCKLKCSLKLFKLSRSVTVVETAEVNVVWMITGRVCKLVIVIFVW